MRHILKPAVSLFFITALAAVSLGLVYNIMEEPIAENRRRATESRLREILPEAASFRNMGEGARTEEDSAGARVVAAFEALGADGGKVGYAVELESRRGYGGPMRLVVGILPGADGGEGRIAGLRVLRHAETPGFGAVISREGFFRRFDGRALVPLRVVRTREASREEFQSIASSTITTDAVVAAVNAALAWFAAYEDARSAPDEMEENG